MSAGVQLPVRDVVRLAGVEPATLGLEVPYRFSTHTVTNYNSLIQWMLLKTRFGLKGPLWEVTRGQEGDSTRAFRKLTRVLCGAQ
jgi:hypothetical protein